MTKNSKRAFISWTGGKDSSLALFLAKEIGYEILGLVTFIPESSSFRAHPLHVIKKQAESLNLPWRKLTVKDPYKQSYEKALIKLKDEFAIDYIITGDIDLIDNHPDNYMKERCEVVGLKIFNPLWQKSRNDIWALLLSNNFKVVITFAKKESLAIDWIGKVITTEKLKELVELSDTNGIDLTGENGEFHTIVIDSPNFDSELKFDSTSVVSDEKYNYVKVNEVILKTKICSL